MCGKRILPTKRLNFYCSPLITTTHTHRCHYNKTKTTLWWTQSCGPTAAAMANGQLTIHQVSRPHRLHHPIVVGVIGRGALLPGAMVPLMKITMILNGLSTHSMTVFPTGVTATFVIVTLPTSQTPPWTATAPYCMQLMCARQSLIVSWTGPWIM
jgi:hypothetical protein